MPSVVNFLGLSVKSFTSKQNWGNSPATLDVELVPDLRAGDEYTYENNGIIPIWEMHTFTAGSFRFRGMISNTLKERSETGNPIYKVTLVDPRQVLEGTKIVIGNYYGLTNVVPNVINAFGYWENVLGFGNSQSNEGGMPWQLILKAVNKVVNEGAAPLYGGQLQWKNSYFTLDLSRIPVPPFFYKIQGNPSVSLLSCIDQVCNDAAMDWYVDVTDSNVITIKTISRRAQLAYNRKSINEYADSIEQAKSVNAGWEGINDGPTSKLLFGSSVSYLYHANQASMYPYWGTDINGNYLYSTDLDVSTTVSLNASICADFLGSYTYATTIGEIRIAMYSEQAWLNYISIRRPDIAALLNIPTFYDTQAIQDLLNGNFTQAGPTTLLSRLNQDVARFFNSTIGGDNSRYERAKRLHQMIQQAGEQYMGRSYLVYLPFIIEGFDIETYQYVYNYVVDQEGGYVGIGEDLLGMNDYNRLLFEASPGRVGPFATYSNTDVDPQQTLNTNTVVQTNAIYIQAGLNSDIKRLPFPCVIVHLSNPLYETKKTVYMAQLTDWISILLNLPTNSTTTDSIKAMMKNNMGVFPVGVGAVQSPKLPDYISIPLRSRIETYGGSISGRGYWSLTGVAGNTDVEQDDNLNPWSFGGYPGMMIAATAKLFQISSQAYAVEFGGMSFPGLPNHSLGDELYYAGSNINSIDISVAANGGFVTNYRLRAFDPKVLGSLAKREEARLQRIGKTLTRIRKEAKEIYERVFNNIGPIVNFATQNYMIHPTLAPRTPHTVIAAKNWTFEDNTAYHEMAFMTPTEALANIDVRSSTSFKNFAMASINSMFRPFSTKFSVDYMPKYTEPVTQLQEIDLIGTSYSFNPYRENNDIMLYSKGNLLTEDARTLGYNGQNNTLRYENQGTYDDIRAVGFKTPMQLVGYGFNLYCNSVITGSGYIGDEDRKKSTLWKAGPLDPLWDQTRGIWTFHDTVVGDLVANISAKTTSTWESGGIRLVGRNDADLETVIPVYNTHNSQISSGTRVTATYNAHANRFVIQSADC